ncbi:hypothetical protein GGQ92_001595 [Gracilibacillus halotolerans]|uniref:Zinc-ribbon domain-containing protein n=1 Tax=Gracilibacillus halotolerans TaxID=74386 RepID=A0A841RMZ0_9BACI|nr:zinc-ribbon domain-containing protein [Gracilibacillus halotolerans]MBB6512806.1 hypothetical protein [Gracilibacillus halotolerans]
MKFCKECGKELKDGEQFCENCGKPVNSETPKEKKQPKEKQQSLVSKFQSLPKAHKLTISIISGILLLFIIFASVVNYMTSSERIVKKFHAAVMEDNYEALGDLVVFDETDEKIGERHAEVLADMIDEQDRLGELMAHFDDQHKQLTSSKGGVVNLQKEGCFLFFDCYEITAATYYLNASSNLNNTEIILDGETVSVIENAEEEQEIGPFVYGSYDLEATYENEFVQFHEEEPVYIYEADQSWRVGFYFESIVIEGNELPIERTFLLNGKELDETMILSGEEGDEIGPIDPEQDYTLEIKATFPWGELTTGEREVDRYFEQKFEISETLMEGLKQGIITFYDDLFEAYRSNNLDSIGYLEEQLLDDYSYDIGRVHDYAEENEDYIHFRDVKQYGFANEPIEIYYNQEDKTYHAYTSMLEESAIETQFYDTVIDDPYYRNNYNSVYFFYKDDKWLVKDAYFGNWADDKEYTMFPYEGEPAKVLHGQKTSTETDKEESDEAAGNDADEAVEKATLSYIDALVEAINAGDYSKVSSTIQSGSALEGMQQDLVNRLYENGTTQEVVSKEVTSTEKDGDAWKVKTSETIKITYESGKEETKDYTWTYTVVEDDGNYKLSNIE